MTDIEEIRNLLGSYCLLIDDGEFDKFEDLLAPDAVLDAMGELVVGRSQIRSFLEENYPARRRGRHITVNSVVEVDGPVGSARSDVIALRKTSEGPVIHLVGRYIDSFTKTDRWRVQRREIRLDDAWMRPLRRGAGTSGAVLDGTR